LPAGLFEPPCMSVESLADHFPAGLVERISVQALLAAQQQQQQQQQQLQNSSLNHDTLAAFLSSGLLSAFAAVTATQQQQQQQQVDLGLGQAAGFGISGDLPSHSLETMEMHGVLGLGGVVPPPPPPLPQQHAGHLGVPPPPPPPGHTRSSSSNVQLLDGTPGMYGGCGMTADRAASGAVSPVACGVPAPPPPRAMTPASMASMGSCSMWSSPCASPRLPGPPQVGLQRNQAISESHLKSLLASSCYGQLPSMKCIAVLAAAAAAQSTCLGFCCLHLP